MTYDLIIGTSLLVIGGLFIAAPHIWTIIEKKRTVEKKKQTPKR